MVLSVVLDSLATRDERILYLTVTVLSGKQVRPQFHPESTSLKQVSYIQAAEYARRIGLGRFADRATGRGGCLAVAYLPDAETVEAVEAAFAQIDRHVQEGKAAMTKRKVDGEFDAPAIGIDAAAFEELSPEKQDIVLMIVELLQSGREKEAQQVLASIQCALERKKSRPFVH